MIIFPTACESCRQVAEELATDNRGGVVFCCHDGNTVWKGVLVSIVARGRDSYWVQTFSPVSKADADTLMKKIMRGTGAEMIAIPHEPVEVH